MRCLPSHISVFRPHGAGRCPAEIAIHHRKRVSNPLAAPTRYEKRQKYAFKCPSGLQTRPCAMGALNLPGVLRWLSARPKAQLSYNAYFWRFRAIGCARGSRNRAGQDWQGFPTSSPRFRECAGRATRFAGPRYGAWQQGARWCQKTPPPRSCGRRCGPAPWRACRSGRAPR